MQIINLYRYRDGTSVIFSPIKPEDIEFEIHYRLIADEGKALTKDGVELYAVIDVEFVEEWYEVNYEEDEDYEY